MHEARYTILYDLLIVIIAYLHAKVYLSSIQGYVCKNRFEFKFGKHAKTHTKSGDPQSLCVYAQLKCTL